MVYERRLRSMQQLRDELRGLEVDAGIRALGNYRGKKSLVFVTKASGDYSVWVRDAKPSPGNGGHFQRFARYQDLVRFLEGVLEKPLTAHIY